MTVTVNPSEGKVQMERTAGIQVVRFYAGEITYMANRCERFSMALGRPDIYRPDIADELRRIGDELDGIARKLEGRA